MAITLAHAFVSGKAQGADATEVSKNEWNAAHTFTMATGALLGRTTASAGTVEEITPNSTDFSYSSTALALAAPDVFRVLTADITGTDGNSTQAVFTTGTFTAAASTTYAFDAFYHITRAAGSTSHTTSTLFSGTATYTSVRYLAQVTNPTGNVLGAVQQIVAADQNAVVLTAANTSTTENLMINLKGILRVNGAGTIIPAFQYSAAPGGAPTIKANTYFRMRKLGSDVVTLAGSWA
jgi:hypothetical protein